MYCNACGTELPQQSRFCPQCGKSVGSTGPAAAPGRPVLERPRQGRKIAGVCLAVARYLGVDVTLVRILWVLLIFIGGGGIVAYLVAWLIIPEEPLVALAAPGPVNGEQNPSRL